MDLKKRKIISVIGTTRKILGITQERLSVEVGCDRRTVAKWESGECKPTDTSLFAVQALHFIMDSNNLELFKEHRHYYQQRLKKGMTAEELVILNSLARMRK